MNKYKFPCGCEFEVTDETIKENDGLPGIKIDYYNIPLDCPITWELLQSGNTKGVFQLETNLGRHWSKELSPTKIDELAALTALIRPGCLKSFIDGKSMPQIYCDRKNAKEEVRYFNEALAPILKDTYGVLTFQEESILIAQELAGFNLQDADILRRGIGHKDAEIIAGLEKQFIDGCKKVGKVSEDDAKEIFGWIKEGQKYLFNACLDPKTTVQTPIGTKTLQEIEIGEKIKAPTSDFTNDEYVTVTNKIDQGIQQLYKVNLESETTIKCTLNHKFLCEDKKVRKLYDIVSPKHKLMPQLKCDNKFENIVAIEPYKTTQTIDITVNNKHHLFYGNNIVTSNSHAVGYSTMSYWAAYVKAHFPLHFYTAWLYFAKEKMNPQQEMQLLASDARYFNIPVKPPVLTKLFKGDLGHFALDNGTIYFGIGDVKGIGESLVTKIANNIRVIEENIECTIDKWTWSDFLIHFSDTVSTTAINGLISVGAIDYMEGSRSKKINQYNTWKLLTQKEREWVKNNSKYNDDIYTCIKSLIENKKRLSKPRKAKLSDLLKETPFSTKDTPYYIVSRETELLGIPLTYSKLDTCKQTIIPDTTCKEFLEGKLGKMTIGVEITDAKKYIISKGKLKGKTMMFVTAEDHTASLDSIIIFPKVLEGKEPLIIIGSTVLLTGNRDRSRTDSFIVETIIQI